jgi:hypothetical protein
VLFRGGERGSWWFAAGFGLFYVCLALFGMITSQPTPLGLQSFDHPIHLSLGVLGLLVAGVQFVRAHGGKAATL